MSRGVGRARNCTRHIESATSIRSEASPGQRLTDRIDDALVGASVRSAAAGCTPVDEAAQPAVAVAVPHPLDGDRARRRARRGQLRGLGHRFPLPDGPQRRAELRTRRGPGGAPGGSPVSASTTCRSHSRAARRPRRARPRAGARPAAARRPARPRRGSRTPATRAGGPAAPRSACRPRRPAARGFRRARPPGARRRRTARGPRPSATASRGCRRHRRGSFKKEVGTFWCAALQS